MTTNIPQVRVEAAAERYDTEAACQARCDVLTAEIVAGRKAMIDSQKIHGACHENMLTDWAYTRYIPDVSVGGDYWSPRLVHG